MTPAQRLSKAAALLSEAAALMDGPWPNLSGSAAHLARAARLRAVMLDSTVVVEIPVQRPIRFTVRQKGDRVTLIDRATGEKRHTSLLEFVGHGTAEATWEAIGG